MGPRISCLTSAFDTIARALRRGTGTGRKNCFTLATRKGSLTRKRHARLPSTRSCIGTIAVTWTSCWPLPALQAEFIASCCACCFCTRTGRRHASFRFSQFHLHLHCRAGSGHEYHRCHAFPLLRSNAHIQYLTDRVDGLITDSTNSPFTRNILPYVYLENPDQKLKWNVYSFDEGIASRVPYESAARVLPQSKRSFAGYTVRQG